MSEEYEKECAKKLVELNKTELKTSDKHDVLYNLELELRKQTYKFFNKDYIEKVLNKTLLEDPKSLSHRLELYIFNYNQINPKIDQFLSDIEEIRKIFTSRKKTIISDKLKDIKDNYNNIMDLRNIFMRRYDSKFYKKSDLQYDHHLSDIFHLIQIYDMFGIRKYFLDNIYYEDVIQDMLKELN